MQYHESVATAVVRCPSVCLSRQNKYISYIFSPSGTHTILVFLYQTLW